VSDNETHQNEMETDDTDDEENPNKKAEDQMKLTWSSIKSAQCRRINCR